MAAVILASAVKELDLTLDDLATNLEFIRTASRLRPRLKDMLTWQTMDGEEKALATAFLRQGVGEESLFYRGDGCYLVRSI